jgi:hypothetical protein
MYENPKLNLLGAAEDVILGLLEDGEDIDGLYVPPPWDFASDLDIEAE